MSRKLVLANAADLRDKYFGNAGEFCISRIGRQSTWQGFFSETAAGLGSPAVHQLLRRQLRKAFGSVSKVPAALRELFAEVDHAYVKLDEERTQLELALAGAKKQVRKDQVERRDLQRRVVAADRLVSLGTLAAGVAHEVNNPLAYVSSNVEFVAEQLRRGHADDPQSRAEMLAALDEAKEGSQRISRIVLDLKMFSRTGGEANAAQDVVAVMHGALELVREQLRKHARINEELHPVPPVMASRSRLEQVFVNLLMNAAQAIHEGTPAHNTIRVRTEHRESEVWIEIEDTGMGMPPEVLQRVFDPFFTTRAGARMGMGLAICHGVVSDMEGSIDLASEVGQGTRVRVRLPAWHR